MNRQPWDESIAQGASARGLLLVVWFACGCSDAGGSVRIGPAGGKVIGAGGASGASVVVPVGALAGEAMVGVAVAASGYPTVPAGLTSRGSVLAFTPHGQVFLAPVRVTVPFTSGSAATMRLRSAAPGGTWEIVEGAAVSGQALQASLSHFSYFVAMESAAIDAGEGAGAIDGTWRLDTKVCDGTPINVPVTTTFTITNSVGLIENIYCRIPVTLSYPASATVGWIIGQHNCPVPDGSPSGVGDQHTATYAVAGGQLTLTEDKTPPTEWGCASGRQVSTFTRQ